MKQNRWWKILHILEGRTLGYSIMLKLCFTSMYSVLNTLSEYTYFYIWLILYISNHPEYWKIDTLTSLICLKFLPVVDIIKTRKS